MSRVLVFSQDIANCPIVFAEDVFRLGCLIMLYISRWTRGLSTQHDNMLQRLSGSCFSEKSLLWSIIAESLCWSGSTTHLLLELSSKAGNLPAGFSVGISEIQITSEFLFSTLRCSIPLSPHPETIQFHPPTYSCLFFIFCAAVYFSPILSKVLSSIVNAQVANIANQCCLGRSDKEYDWITLHFCPGIKFGTNL